MTRLTSDIERQVRSILHPDLLRSVYRHKFPWPKQHTPSGAVAGHFHFNPSAVWIAEFSELIFEAALQPLSQLPLGGILELNLPTLLLPEINHEEYPELSLGLVTLLDQSRLLLGTGYNTRYMRGFFDPLAEKLVRQLVLPYSNGNLYRPDHMRMWFSRGYSFNDWLVRVLWYWGPLVHSDSFMVQERTVVKSFLHDMRGEVEAYCGYSDPYKCLEAQDDMDLTLFACLFQEQPPLTTYQPTAKRGDDGKLPVATAPDYAFWWIRILNAHFAITDTCGHYPFWIRALGRQWSEKDHEYMNLAGSRLFAENDESTLDVIRKDVAAGVWQPLAPPTPNI